MSSAKPTGREETVRSIARTLESSATSGRS